MPILAQPRSISNNYRDTADTVRALPDLLASSRTKQGITSRTQAAQIGISLRTLDRLGNTNPTQTTILACLDWLAKQT
jgi:hypothetical protein